MAEIKTDKASKVTGSYGILWVAGSIFFILLVCVSIHFSSAELPNCKGAKDPVGCTALYWAEYRASWGQFGDFMGGMVNPFIGLLTIYLLVTTIAQQSRALDQTESAIKPRGNFCGCFDEWPPVYIHQCRSIGYLSLITKNGVEMKVLYITL
jgi:hypothetical protein